MTTGETIKDIVEKAVDESEKDFIKTMLLKHLELRLKGANTIEITFDDEVVADLTLSNFKTVEFK